MGRIAAGRLNRLVTIQRQAAAAHDGYSRAPGAWTTVGTRWASVMPARGREGEEAQGRSGLALMTFWFHYETLSASISERDSLVLDGKRYQITSPPMEVGYREGVEIFAVAAELENASAPVT